MPRLTRGQVGQAAGEAAAPSRFDVNDTVLVASVSKALRMLGLFSTERPAWSLQDMRRSLGLSKPMTYRLARTLEYEGFIALDEERGIYHIGPSIIPCASLIHSETELTRLAQPYLEELVKKTEESAVLALEMLGSVVVVELVATPHFFKPPHPALWIAVSSLANACARVIAAFKSEGEREKLVAQPQEKLTEATITDPEAIRAELEKVRREGIAFDIEEHTRGLCAVAAPVLASNGRPLAAIAIIAPCERFSPEIRPRYAELTKEAGEALSKYLGVKSEKA
jgi:DNA-binding IclR family transcriptional regulator